MRTTLGQAGRRGHAKAVLATLATAIVVAACGASATASPPAATAAPSSAAPSVAAPSVAASSSAPSASVSPTSAALSAAASFAPPTLTGQTIRITVGAAPDPGDTKVQLISDILQKWGATTSIINQTGDPAAIRVLLAGQADIGSIAVSTAINSGLMIFGPSQPRLEYHFIGAPAIKTIADLPGHTYGTSNVHGLEALMFADLLSKNNIDPSKVNVTIAGGASVRVAAMLAGHIDATFVHADAVAKLTAAGFNDLAKMSDVAPELADSFLGASPAWVTAHPDLATAVDEAWILAAQTFNTDKTTWIAAAVKYGGGTAADAGTLYDTLLAANTFPAAKSAFSASSASAQEALAFKVGAINSNPDLTKWFTETAWDQATAALALQ